MRHHDITQPNRFRLPTSHPVLATLSINPEDWFHLQRLDAANPGTDIIGHDAPQGGLMTVYVACASDEVRNRLRDGWD